MKDYEKSILLFIDKHPKPKKYQIVEDFKNLIDYEDISDLLNGWNDEGIIYMNYGYFCLTDYGEDLVKEIRHNLIINKHNRWKKARQGQKDMLTEEEIKRRKKLANLLKTKDNIVLVDLED